jgi:hypothetical protein
LYLRRRKLREDGENFMTCTPHQVLLGCDVKDDEMVEAYSTHRKDKYIQNFDPETWSVHSEDLGVVRGIMEQQL